MAKKITLGEVNEENNELIYGKEAINKWFGEFLTDFEEIKDAVYTHTTKYKGEPQPWEQVLELFTEYDIYNRLSYILSVENKDGLDVFKNSDNDKLLRYTKCVAIISAAENFVRTTDTHLGEIVVLIGRLIAPSEEYLIFTIKQQVGRVKSSVYKRFRKKDMEILGYIRQLMDKTFVRDPATLINEYCKIGGGRLEDLCTILIDDSNYPFYAGAKFQFEYLDKKYPNDKAVEDLKKICGFNN